MDLTLLPAVADSNVLSISAPAQNSVFVEGDVIDLDFAVSNSSDVRWLKASIVDFNGSPISQRYISAGTTSLALETPIVNGQSVFYVQLEAYVGEQLAPVMKQVAIKVLNDSSVLEPQLHGVSDIVIAGSQLDLSVTADNAASTRIDVSVDGEAQVMAFGPVSFTVPGDAQTLSITATATNEEGVQFTQVQSVQVISGPVWQLQTLNADVLLPTTQGLVSTQGRSLLLNGSQLGRLPANILDLVQTSQSLWALDSNAELWSVQLPNFERSKVMSFGQSMISLSSVNDALFALGQDGQLYRVENGNAIVELTAVNGIRSAGETLLYWQGNLLKQRLAFGQSKTILNASQNIKDVVVGLYAYWVVDAAGNLIRIEKDSLLTSNASLDASVVNAIEWNGTIYALTETQKLYALSATANAQPLGYWNVTIESADELVLWNNRLMFQGSDLTLLNDAFGMQAAFEHERNNVGIVNGVVATHDYFVASAGSFGAVLGRQSGLDWVASEYPVGGYKNQADDVAINDRYTFVLQKNNRRVVAIRHQDNYARTIISQADIDRIAANNRYIVTQSGSQVRLYDATTFANVSLLDLGTENIVQMALAEELVLVTDSNTVYKVTHNNPQILQRVAQLPAGTTHHLATSGNGIVVTQAQRLYTINSLNGAWQQHDLTAHINAVTLVGSDLLFVDNAQPSLVKWLRVKTDSQIVAFDAGSKVNDLAFAGGRVFASLVENGVSVYRLAENELPTSPLVYMTTDQWLVGQPQELALTHLRTSVATALVTDNQSYLSSTVPAEEVAVSLVAQESIGGSTVLRLNAVSAESTDVSSTNYGLSVLDRSLPASYGVQVSAQGSYTSAPLFMKANISGDYQVVDQVEFYVKAPSAAQFVYAGRDSIAPYQLEIAASLEGDYEFYAVAMDKNAGSIDSTVQQITRVADTVAPQVTLSVVGDLVAGQTILANVTIIDAESGLNRANAYLDGEFVQPIFGQNTTQLALPAITEGNHEFSVVATDNAGNIETAVLPLNISVDQPPVINSFTASSEIRERTYVNVQLSASDDVAIAEAYITWNGVKAAIDAGGAVLSFNDVVKDQRTVRVNGSVMETITVELVDGSGQKTEQSLQVTVVEDLDPNASAITLASINGNSVTRGESFYLRISGLDAVDDGPRADLTLSVEANGEVVATPRATSNLIHVNVDVPVDAPSTWPVRVRVSDRLGQTAVTNELTLTTIGQPNLLSLVTDAGQSPSVSNAGDSARFAVKVSDDQAVGLQNQVVQWSLEAVAGATVTDLGQTVSDSSGVAYVDVNTVLAAGSYQVTAQLPAHTTVSPLQTTWTIEAGAPSELRIAQIRPTRVGQPLAVSAVLLDVAGNETASINQTPVDFSFVNSAGADSLFAFSGAGASTEFEEGRAITTLTLDAQNGAISALITAPLKVLKDSQWLDVSFTSDALQASYDHDNNPATPALTLSRIPLLVEPGSATQA
ncbi:MAG: hypothetical protein R3227_12045, partial [Reinekea sp.]|nr:hypothetical protein [Reinekea sp.]